MAIVRDAAKNVLNFVRRRALENDQDTDDAVLSPTPVHTLEGHTSWVWSVAFLPDNEHVVSGSGDDTVRKWRVSDGREVGKVMNHGSWVNAVAVSGDGKVIASGGTGGNVVFWDCETCEKLVESQEKHDDWIRSLSFAPDSQTIASGSVDGSVVVWSVLTGERVAGPVYGGGGWVMCVAFSPAGDKIAGSDGRIRVWDSLLQKEIIPAISVRECMKSVAWSPDGRQLICGVEEGNIHFFDSSNGALLATCRAHTSAVSSIAVSQGGTFSASASWDRTVRLWSTSTHQQLASLEHPDELDAVAISRNDRYLASGGDIGKLYIWRLPDSDRTLQENKQDSTSSIVDPSGSQPAPLSSDPDTGSTEHATPAQDPEDDGDEPQGSGADQGHPMTRTASGDSWLDMPAVALAPAPARNVPVEDPMFAQFFGEDVPAAPLPESRDDRPAKWKKKAKESHQHLFKQLKNFRAGFLPRDGPSDMNNAPRPSSSQKLKDRISRIHRRSSLVPENAERPAEERDSDQQGKNKADSPTLKPSFVAYNRLRQVLVIASNDPPIQQKKLYFIRRNGQLIRKPDPSVPHTSSHTQSPQPGPSASAIRTSPQRQGASSSTVPPASAPGSSQDIDVEGCGCCGFFISVRRL